jgi:coenzyme F420-reducing hydrogenase beta subunit
MRVNNFREVNSRSIGGDDVFLKMSCCGCSACLQKCPKKCIEMHEDAEGFLYPEINDDFCIDCGICYNVCPVRNQKPNCKPLAFYASQSKDETLRLQSSSGGIFSLLAEYIIRKGGIVFGARFNEKNGIGT